MIPFYKKVIKASTMKSLCIGVEGLLWNSWFKSPFTTKSFVFPDRVSLDSPWLSSNSEIAFCLPSAGGQRRALPPPGSYY